MDTVYNFRRVRAIDIWYSPTIRPVQPNIFGDSLSIEIALTIDFRDCPLIGIVRTIDVSCFETIGIV